MEMKFLSLPLPSNCPFPYPQADLISESHTSAFTAGIDKRDVFRGVQRCVICGTAEPLEHAHIIPRVEDRPWNDLKARDWVPNTVKRVDFEPRNGILLCKNCHNLFDRYRYFIRYIPKTKRFLFVNYGDISSEPYTKLHFRYIGLRHQDRYSPIPTLFLIHECRVRGFHPFKSIQELPSDFQWADWIPQTAENDIDRSPLPPSSPPNNPPHEDSAGETGGGYDSTGSATGETRRFLTFDEHTIQGILQAQRNLPTWKACIIENTSWKGSAEENIEKYKEVMRL
ncbi:hypothetical protein D9758_003614 [Tetrapyrgos nigripes]|uniref:HNH nuclease domain-containing protein n=1 Tax=Tetrapyrgos nigripes TaxID=182062 RepID=A0A8H5GME7_9AGAR|nr:hypothetical protein D9758_003614 [Tetrapyrgos nigripes]